MNLSSLKILFFGLYILSFNCSAQNYPGFDIIGRGYNIFDEFANNKSKTQYPIFDFSRMALRSNSYGHQLPKFISIENISDHVIETIEGTSVNSYIKNYADQLNMSFDAFIFEASFKNQFKFEKNESTEYLYYTYMDINTKWRINLDVRTIDSLIQYLDAQFRNDLENMDPKRLFEIYGTHFISNAYLGGRIDFSSVSEINSEQTTAEIINAIHGRYRNLSGGITMSEKQTNILEQCKTKTKLNVVGGNSEFANSIENNSDYKKWAEGIYTKPVLSGFDENSLIPIWMLCKNLDRKSVLLNYFENSVLKAHPLPIFYEKNQVFESAETIYKPMKFNLVKFKIHQDCSPYNLLNGDQPGQFYYSVRLAAEYNQKEVDLAKFNDGWFNKNNNESLILMKTHEFEIPLETDTKIKVYVKLTEYNELSSNDIVGHMVSTHTFPFTTESLYNLEEDGYLYETVRLFNSNDCYATLYYQLIPNESQTAIDFGNKGWEAFEKGDYKKSLEYSEEALKENNSLGYVHYNVALVWLVQNNPNAFVKYQSCVKYFPELENVKGALKDILDYEKIHGPITGAEKVKLLLESKLK